MEDEEPPGGMYPAPQGGVHISHVLTTTLPLAASRPQGAHGRATPAPKLLRRLTLLCVLPAFFLRLLFSLFIFFLRHNLKNPASKCVRLAASLMTRPATPQHWARSLAPRRWLLDGGLTLHL